MSRRAPYRSASRPVQRDAGASTPARRRRRGRPTRAGVTPRSDCSCSDMIGSSIASVDAIVTTAAPHAATARTRTSARTGTSSRAACRSGNRTRAKRRAHGDRRARHAQKRQAHAAPLVQPAADRRPEHEAEAAAGHHEAHHAAALLGRVEIGDQREADDPRDGVGGALHQPRREEPRRACAQRRTGASRRRARRGRRAAARAAPPDPTTRPAGIDTTSRRRAERREQQPDDRRRRAEPPPQIGQHRHRDRVGDDVGEGRAA